MANYLVTLKGTLVPTAQAEVFLHTCAVVSAATQGVVAQDAAEVWEAVWAGPGGQIANSFPASTRYDEAMAAEILDPFTGRLTAATHVPFTTPLIGTNLTGLVANQLALCVSMRAGFRANGTPLRGRTYLPMAAVDGVDTGTGHLKTAYVSVIGDGWADFVTGMGQRGHPVCVWSRKEGRLQTVDLVRMGNIIDTIRSRRNSTNESYQDFPIIPE